MTEAQWLNSTDRKAMLDFLWNRTSERKIRLFHCACARRVLSFLKNPRGQYALEAVEAYADGNITNHELRNAYLAVEAVWKSDDSYAGPATAADWLLSHPGYTENDPNESPDMVISEVEQLAFNGQWHGDDNLSLSPERACETELLVQANLIREIFGNPFRPVARTDRYDARVNELAMSIYSERTFGRLSELANALEETGFSNGEILEHFRLPGLHVRGCWALDLVLGKF